MSDLVRVDAERFRHAPMGSVHVGPTLLVWAASPRLVGSAGWGVVQVDQIQGAIALWLQAVWPKVEDGVCLITDMSAFAPLLPETYQAFAEFGRGFMPALAAKKTRHLVLLPEAPTDVMRVISAGFLTALGATHDHFVTSDAAAGADWLGGPSRAVPAMADRIAEIKRIIADAESATWLVRRVRQAIAADLLGPDLDRVATTLGMSQRSLQRALADQGTSFRDEVASARVEFAARLLHETDDKVAAIASRVGFASASHFAAIFRRARGVTPEAFRKSR